MEERSQFGLRRVGDQEFGVRFRRGSAYIQALQLRESAIVGTLGGIDAALQTGEAVAGAIEDLAERGILFQTLEGFFRGGDFVFPELGFDATKATEIPIGLDEGIDEEAFQRSGRLKLPMVVRGEEFQFFGIFAGDDLGLGIDARFECVETGRGLPLCRARTGRPLRIPPIRFDLLESRHTFSRLQGSGHIRGGRPTREVKCLQSWEMEVELGL